MAQCRSQRIKTLQRRADFLTQRWEKAKAAGREPEYYDMHERNALVWAIRVCEAHLAAQTENT